MCVVPIAYEQKQQQLQFDLATDILFHARFEKSFDMDNFLFFFLVSFFLFVDFSWECIFCVNIYSIYDKLYREN